MKKVSSSTENLTLRAGDFYGDKSEGDAVVGNRGGYLECADKANQPTGKAKVTFSRPACYDPASCQGNKDKSLVTFSDEDWWFQGLHATRHPEHGINDNDGPGTQPYMAHRKRDHGWGDFSK